MLLATSRAAPRRALWSLVQLLRKLGCAHATVLVGAATKRQVAKETALHVQYLLKSILCNSHEQIQQLTTRVAAILFLLYQSPSQECHHSCPITKEVTKVTGHQLSNETQGARVIPDLFLEHPEFGHLLARCQCPQSNFRTGHPLFSLSFRYTGQKNSSNTFGNVKDLFRDLYTSISLWDNPRGKF